ncbi:hypothetical protein HZB74_01560 [Candidatus Saccharibacteria bacterium]|nr:hypothetical protein [Candidatus Saccharibacteria bacterium]
MSDKTEVKASKHESYLALTIVAFFIPIIGLIVGIVYIAKDKRLDKKLGEHLIAISILFMILQTIFWYLTWGRSTTLTTYSPPVVSSVVDTPVVSSWDPNTYYQQIQNGQTKAQVEKLINKTSDSCTTSETPGVGTMELCDYGSPLTDKGSLMITYIDGRVYSKTKTTY